MSARSRNLLVYFFRPRGFIGPVKIGCSSVPTNRIENLALWSPFPLELIGTVSGSMQDERYLHKCFSHLHLHHEWFEAKPELLLAVERILEQGVQYAREHLTPTGDIRPVLRSAECRQRMSIAMKNYWVRERARRASAFPHPRTA